VGDAGLTHYSWILKFIKRLLFKLLFIWGNFGKDQDFKDHYFGWLLFFIFKK
jgi:hypothetical protein